MNKRIFLTALSALICLIGQTREASGLWTTNWRNTTTGDWVIGFYDDFAIYDCQFWNYKQRQQKGGNYALTLECNGKNIVVEVGKCRNGKRTITINGAKDEYAPISSATLPDYPTKDVRTGFKDTKYLADTVTLVGWLKDMPKHARDKGGEYEVAYNDLFTDKEISFSGKIDSIGRFVVKIPMINTSEVFLDWKRSFIHSVFEPGETYFLLFDFKEGQKLFMGRDCRVQNELLACKESVVHVKHGNNMDEATAMQYLERRKKGKMKVWKELDSVVAAHPNISQRYINYLKDMYNISEGRDLMQARFYMKAWKMPPLYLDYVTRQHWQNPCRPYTLFRDFSTFMHDYTELIKDDDWGERLRTTAQRLEQLGAVSLTADEKTAMDQYVIMKRDLDDNLVAATTEAEADSMTRAFNESETIGKISALIKRLGASLQDEMNLSDYHLSLQAFDGAGNDRLLRDIHLARGLIRSIDESRQPLSTAAIELMEKELQMPAAKAAVMAQHEKYTTLLGRDFLKSSSLKTADIVAKMSDGEEILRKIIEPYKGRFILLDIWGTWCAPCKAALANSKKEYERLKDYGLVYLYLANGSSDESWKNVIKEYELTGDDIVHYNLPAAQQRAIEGFLGVHSFPAYRLIDRDGSVVDVNVDARDLEGLARLLDGLL